MASIPHYVSLDFAHATEAVLFVMCGIMALAGLIAVIGLERGRQETVPGVERGTETTPARALISATPRPTLDDAASASGGLSVGMKDRATTRPRRGAAASHLCQVYPAPAVVGAPGRDRAAHAPPPVPAIAVSAVRPRDGLQCRNQGDAVHNAEGNKATVDARRELQP